MTDDDWDLLEQAVNEWMETLAYATWGPGYDLSDSEERPEAASWFVRQMRLMDEWMTGEMDRQLDGLISNGVKRDSGVSTGSEPYPTFVADPGLAERDADTSGGYLRRKPESWGSGDTKRALDGEI